LAGKATTQVKVTNSVECRDDEHFHRSGKFSFETKLSPTFPPKCSYKILKNRRRTASISLKNADHAPE